MTRSDGILHVLRKAAVLISSKPRQYLFSVATGRPGNSTPTDEVIGSRELAF